MNRLLKKLKDNCLGHRFYGTLDDLPMHNWVRAGETGDLSYIIRKKRFSGDLHAHWEKLNDEYIARWGINDTLQGYLNLVRKQVVNIKKAIVDGDPLAHLKMQIDRIQIEKYAESEKEDFAEKHAVIEKFMGIRIDLKTISVNEYMGKVELMNKQIKKAA